MEFIPLTFHQVIHEAGEAIKSAYGKYRISFRSHRSARRKGRCGGHHWQPGVHGAAAAGGIPHKSKPIDYPRRGHWLPMRRRCSDELCPGVPPTGATVHRFGQELAMQTAQIAACNALHGVQERLARWLLMSQDRILSDSLPVTQEFVAQMLGTRRASVSEAAGVVQRERSVSNGRGRIRIVNRQKLEDAACDCYEMLQRRIESES